MKQTLSNHLVTVSADTMGAELQSIENRLTGQQYLWQGDPKFWKRRSPVLFPIVGAVWNGHFSMDGREFPMGQHGFARDMEFNIVENTPEEEMWFSLESSEETLKRYPRRFRLEIGYRLDDTRITVMWRVTNLDDEPMYFQIGAHPAFNLPDFNAAAPVHGYMGFNVDSFRSEVIADKGCVGEEFKDITVDKEGFMPIDAGTFADDALIVGGDRIHRVSLLSAEHQPYITLFFNSPYVGLWAPAPDAPFVCIEPWWGRADSVGFDGDFSAKTAVNRLEPGRVFEAQYLISLDNI